MHDKLLQRRAAVEAERRRREGAQMAQVLIMDALDDVFDEINRCEDDDVRAGMQEVVGRLARAAVGDVVGDPQKGG